ncbi:MAG TPA: hypothetical protein VFM79_05045 [Pelobium sp.]|nr:hypothetical protein [Pelobium sp.]
MKKKLLLFTWLCAFCLVTQAQTLVHHWNFNDSGSETLLLSPSVGTTGTITHNVITNSEILITNNTTGQGFETTNPNARNSDAAGSL